MKEIRKSFWDFVAVTGSTLIAVPLMLLSEALQARYLGPGGYGKVALILSAISLLYLAAHNWLHRSIMRFGKEEFIQKNHLRSFTADYLLISIFCFITAVFLFNVLQKPILQFLEIRHPYAFWIIVLGLYLNVTRQFVFEVLKIIRKIKLQTLLFRIVSKLFIVLAILFSILVFLKLSVNYVIAIFLLSDAVVIGIGLFNIPRRFFSPLQFDRGLLKRILVYSFPLILFSWSNYVLNWVGTYIVKYYMTMNDVGIYQAAVKILNTVKSFYGMGIVTVTTPIIMVLKTNNNIDKIRNLYLKRFVPYVSYLTMLSVTVIIVFSDILFQLIYGTKFESSIVPFKIIITSVSFSTLGSVFLPIVTSFDMTKMMLKLGLLASFVNISLNFLLVPKFGIAGAAAAGFVTFSLNPVIWYFYLDKEFRFHTKTGLLFPFFTIAVLVVNIAMMSFWLKILASTGLMFIATWIGRNMRLFMPEDMAIISNVKMPEILKSGIYKTLKFLSK